METPKIIFSKTPNFLPLVSFERIELAQANACLAAWNHKMGELHRGNNFSRCHALFHEGRPVAVTTVSTLIGRNVGGGLTHLTRENTIELSRLCAERSGLCRVALRLWREFVFPALPYQFAISYQDADMHNGNTYRFDGWLRHDTLARSGTNTRNGKQGRRKYVWIWERKDSGNGASSPDINVGVSAPLMGVVG